jgi:hypothetical protein
MLWHFAPHRNSPWLGQNASWPEKYMDLRRPSGIVVDGMEFAFPDLQ